MEVRKTEIGNQLSLGLQQLGLDKMKIDATIKSQEFQDSMGLMATMLEMAGDDPDAVEFASKNFLGFLKTNGTITQEQYDSGIAAFKNPPPAESTESSFGTKTKNFFRDVLWGG